MLTVVSTCADLGLTTPLLSKFLHLINRRRRKVIGLGKFYHLSLVYLNFNCRANAQNGRIGQDIPLKNGKVVIDRIGRLDTTMKLCATKKD